MAMKRNGRMPPTKGTIFSTVGFVSAPKCDSCGTDLVAASTTEWVCVNAPCPENGRKKNTGVYPVQEAGRR
jgi:hypothetical protein